MVMMKVVMLGGRELRERLERGGGVQRVATRARRVDVLPLDSGRGVLVLGGDDGGV